MNPVLPYCRDQPSLEKQESADYLQTIKQNLTSAIRSADFVRGAFFWSKQLENYLDLKFQLLKADRLWFAKLFYQLMCNRSVSLDPNADQSDSRAEAMDWSLIEHWCLMCWRMLEDYDLFRNTDLQFEWRPLYFLLKEVLLPRQRQKVFPRQVRHLETVVKFLPIAKRFFVASAGSEITLMEELCDEFLPKINLELASHAFPTCLAWFTGFAPVTLKTQHLITESIVEIAVKNNKSEFKINQELEWTKMLFDLWGCIVPSQTIDLCFTEMIAELCANQYGQNTFYLNESQLRFLLSNAHRALRLPIGSGISMGEGGAISVGSKKVLSSGNPITGMKIASIDNICVKSSIMKKRVDYLKSIAKIIVYNIFPKSFHDNKYHPNMENDVLLDLLETWFQSLESFCHPSNHGQWSRTLADLLHNISQQLLNRLIWEGLEKGNVKFTDQSLKCRRYSPIFNMDVSSRQRLVKMMRPLLLMSMFSKDAQARSLSQLALSYLMKRDPQLLLPKLLEEIDPSLTTLTETHRTTAAISLLGEIANPMIHRIDCPEGAKHLINLMYNVLPGLDVNDPVKTNSSYGLISKILVYVPLNDLSSLADSVSSESEKQLLISTSLFEEWTHSFLDKTFELLEKVPHMRENSQEANVFRHAMFSCNILANQLSIPGCERLRDSVLERIFRLMTERVIHQAFGTIFNIVYNFCSVFPELMFEYLPILKKRIFEEIESGAAADPYKAFKGKSQKLEDDDIYGTDATLIWYLKCVYAYCTRIGSLAHDQNLFQKYVQMLFDIADQVWQKCQTRYAYKIATKMYRSIFGSLGDIWLEEYRSIPNTNTAEDEVNYWGVAFSERLKINNLNQESLWKAIDPSWHIPNALEKRTLFEKLTLIADAEISSLNDSLKIENLGEGVVGSAKLCKSITILCRILDSIAPLIRPYDSNDACNEEMMIDEIDDNIEEDLEFEFDDDDDEEEVEYETEASGLQRIPVHAYYCFPHGSKEHEVLVKLKEKIGKLLIQVGEYVNTKREADIDVLLLVVKAIHIFINNRGIDKQKYAELNNSYAALKSMFMTQINSVIPRQYPRFLLLYRLRLQDKKRKYHNAFLPIRKSEQDIALNLLKFCQSWAVSQFAEIRAISQSVLFKCLRFFKSFKYDLVQNVLNILKESSLKSLKEKEGHDLAEAELIMSRIKGCLYILRNAAIQNVCLRTPKFVSQFMICMCNVARLDKPSIQQQLTQVFSGFLERFVESPFTTIPSKIVLSLLGETNIEVSYGLLRTSQAKKAEEKIQQLLKTRREVISYITEDGNPHWHVTFVGLHFCEILHRVDVPLTEEAAKFILHCLNDEVLSIRKNSLSVLLRLMYILKQRSSTDNTDLKYSKFVKSDGSQAVRSLSSQNTLISDKPEIGWQFHSTFTKVYSMEGVPSGSFMSDPTSVKVSSLMETFFSSSDFWTKFFGLIAQESAVSKSNSTAEEFLSVITVKFYKSIFQLFHDKFLYNIMDPIISKWFTSYTDKALQRAALEFIMGLIRGMKHWTPLEREKCWKWLLPKMKAMMINATPDMSTNWNSGFFWMMQNRHPARFLPMIQMILFDKEFEINFESDAAFNESKKLNYVRLIFRNFGSRVADLFPKVVEVVFRKNGLASRYQIVRNAVGSLVWELVCAVSAPKSSISAISYLKDASKTSELTKTCDEWYSVGTQGGNMITDILSQLEGLYQAVDPSKIYGTAYSNLAKTVSKVLSDGLGCGRPYLLTKALFEPFSSKLKYSILGHLLIMQATDDKDLSETAFSMAGFVPDLPLAYRQRELFPSLMLEELNKLAFTQAKNGDEESSKRNKILALALLQVLFFRNLFEMITPRFQEKCMDIIMAMLHDPNVEIRQLASISLSGIVRTCSKNVITQLQEQFTQWLQIPLRRASDTGVSKSMPVIPENVAKRHGAVLGISALVFAHPYTIPKWLPDLLLLVSKHRSDPSPIATSVQYLFNEFRRTHQDTWSDVVGKTDYVDFYQFSVVDKKQTRAAEEETGVFTQKHLEALEGLLTNAAQYFY